MKPLLLFSTLLPLLTSIALAQDKNSPEQIVAASNRAFETAYNSANIEGVVALFTDDAQFTSEDGAAHVGKNSIEAMLRTALANDPGVQLKIETRTARLLAPGAIVENGFSTTKSKNGDSGSSLFTAVYVEKDGKWKITELVESPVAALTPADHLQDLDWLVGSWTESDPSNDVTVTSQFNRARGNNFLTRNVTVKRGDRPAMEGWQIIGWDPIEEQIRSWTFDSEGGYSDGLWTRSGNRWLVQEVGFAPDGSRNSAEITISKLGPDRFTWQSDNRTLNGEPQPSLASIEVTRVKGK